MISSDQPNCFDSSILAAVSSKADGTMLDRTKDFHEEGALSNRHLFCNKAGANYDSYVYQLVTYKDDDSYDKITEVGATDTTKFKPEVHGDGLFTSEAGVGLFLPVADCVATIVYDPKKKHLALLHLGRHATYANLSTCAIKYFKDKGSRPEDLLVWMSPSAGPASYLLEWFDRENDPAWQGFYKKTETGYYLDLAGYNEARFKQAGVLENHIYKSSVDTMTDDNYFSHKGGDTNGRIAVVAMIR